MKWYVQYLYSKLYIPKSSKGIHLQTPSAYDKIEIQIPTMMTLKEITITGFAKQLN